MLLKFEPKEPEDLEEEDLSDLPLKSPKFFMLEGGFLKIL